MSKDTTLTLRKTQGRTNPITRVLRDVEFRPSAELPAGTPVLLMDAEDDGRTIVLLADRVSVAGLCEVLNPLLASYLRGER